MNRQLESHGLKVKQAEAAIVDATLIRSAARPRRTLETTGAGTIKRRFRMTRASYFTRDKVDAQFAMKAIGLNLLKAVNKVILT